MDDNLSKTYDLKESLRLKLPEPEIQGENPWADDSLKRSDVAEKLTKLISGQSDPFVISLHGHWGTGKTFLLKRWQKQLENDGFRAIYFNAWEDDFCRNAKSCKNCLDKSRRLQNLSLFKAQ